MLEGLDGVNKMSKSLGNYIGITESPEQIFGKIMSVSDELMWRYIELLSFESVATIRKWKQEVEAGRNPREVKVDFSREIVARFHDRAAADKAAADFESRFKQGEIPDNMPEFTLPTGGEPMLFYQVLKQAGLTASTSEAIRMIEQGGVRMNGVKVRDKALKLPAGGPFVLQIGKRKFVKVLLS